MGTLQFYGKYASDFCFIVVRTYMITREINSMDIKICERPRTQAKLYAQFFLIRDFLSVSLPLLCVVDTNIQTNAKVIMN